MTEKTKPTHTKPGGFQQTIPPPDDDIVNDSFGTVDIADSTGPDESKKPVMPST